MEKRRQGDDGNDGRDRDGNDGDNEEYGGDDNGDGKMAAVAMANENATTMTTIRQGGSKYACV